MLSAGFGYAWTAIASKLLTDELAAGTLLVAVGWLATAAASEGLALLSEMSALQRRPATHVAPVMFAVQVLVPVLAGAADLRARRGRRRRSAGRRLVGSMAMALAGTTLLAGSRAVGAVIESAHSGDSDSNSARFRSAFAASLAAAFALSLEFVPRRLP